jgi:DNA-binding NtrC family response regulator
MKPSVLLVEGDAELGRALGEALAARFDCLHAATLHEAVHALVPKPWAAVVAGYDLADGGNGLEVLQVARTSVPRAFRLLHTTIASPGFHEDARRTACPHFLADMPPPALVGAIGKALAELLEPPSLELPPDLRPILDEVFQTRAPLVREFLRDLTAAAESDAPVYLYGEPATGVARSAGLLRQWRRDWKGRGSPGARAGVPPVFVLRVPSLRERPQDLPLLAARCLLEHARLTGEPVRRLSPRAVGELLSRDWFGNVVELATVLNQSLQRVGSRPVIEAEDLPRDLQPGWRPSQWAKDDGQRDCLLRQLRLARNVSRAARLEGCSRANYIRLMRRLGIVRADVATEAPPRDWTGVIGPPQA